MDSLRVRYYAERMDRNRAGMLYGAAFVLASLMMGGLYWLLTGINDDYGLGVATGFFLGAGLFFLASRSARESD